MKGLMYYSPRIYRVCMRAGHFGVFQDRIKEIRSRVGAGRVVELGCGPATMQRYLDNPYLGVEKNPRFAEYAKKKKRNVVEDDVFNHPKYLRKGDVVLLVDVLHHIPEHVRLLSELMESKAEKIVVCEPYNKPDSILHSSRFLNNILDHDGINDSQEWYAKEELLALYGRYDAGDIKEIRNSLIATIKIR